MNGSLPLTVVAAGAIAGVLALIVLLWWCRRSSKQDNDSQQTNNGRAESLQSGVSRLQDTNRLHRRLDINSGRKVNYSVFRRDASSKPLFSWVDHPSLVTDAIENGWSGFAFSDPFGSSLSIRSTRSKLLGACATGDHGREVETSWEIGDGSADYMQKIKFSNTNSSMAGIKTGLPLPGPPLGNSSFPQEAYFEITILSSGEDDNDPFGNGRRTDQGEKTKLIQDSSKRKPNSESLVHVTSGGPGNNKLEELKVAGKEGGEGEAIRFTMGLSRGGHLPTKFPGSYPGSIGFNSDGSVHLNGSKLIMESEKEEWVKTGRVVGCGYNPSQRKVFFTVDSEVAHVINCKSEEFGAPLYPTMAANIIDIQVIVNFGQSAFKYEPANAQRTPNPCFIGPLASSPPLGYEDSKELFSMGRINSQWRNQHAARSTGNKTLDFDDESEADLFEIVLDSSGRSPNTVLK